MAVPSSHRGEMSQDSLQPALHRTRVPSRAADPAARRGKSAYNALSAASVGLELGLSVAIGLLGGFYLDRWLETEPLMMIVCMLLGLVAGFRGVFRAVARADRAAAETATELAADKGSHGHP